MGTSTTDFSLGTASWNGELHTPNIETIEHGGRTLVRGIDFEVTNEPSGDIRDAGSYSFTFVFEGNYAGTVVRAFVVTMDVRISFINLNPILLPDTAVMANITPTNDGRYQGLVAPAFTPGYYEFVGWSFGGVMVDNGEALMLAVNHSLTAVWRIVAPIVTTTEIDVVFDGNYHTLTATVTNMIPGATYTFAWYRVGTPNNTLVGAGQTLSLRNVADSGLYFVVVTVTDHVIAARSTTSANTNVVITRAQLAEPVITRNGTVLSWVAVPRATGFEISVDGGVWTEITALTYFNGVFSYDITAHLRPINNQTFRVRAISTDPNTETSDPGNELIYRHLPAPPAPVINRENDTNVVYWDAVHLSFDDNGDSVGYATHYRVYRNGVLIAVIEITDGTNNLTGGTHSIDVTQYLVPGYNRITVTAVWQSYFSTPWSAHSNYIDIFRDYSYTVVFVDHDGTVLTGFGQSGLTQEAFNELLLALPRPADTNTHIFLRWEQESHVTGVVVTTVTFRAVRSPIFSITFRDAYANEHGNPVTFTELDLGLTGLVLQAPVAREGYVFTGWFTADGTQVERITGLDNITIYAGWQPEESSVFPWWWIAIGFGIGVVMWIGLWFIIKSAVLKTVR